MDMEWIYASAEKEPLREYLNQITAELANALLPLSMGWGKGRLFVAGGNGSGMKRQNGGGGRGVSLGRRGEIKTKF
jgi:hypothetical protein